MKCNCRFLICLALFAFLLTVPIYWIGRQGNWEKISTEENRPLVTFPKISLDFQKAALRYLNSAKNSAFKKMGSQVLRRSYQKEIENAAVDQFPLRIELIRLERMVERNMISAAYSILSDPAVPASAASDLLIMRDGSTIMYPPAVFNDQVKQNIDHRIDNYKELVKLFPGQHFYIFYLERLLYSKSNPMNSYFPDADQGRAFEYFEKNLPGGIVLSKMILTSYPDFQDNFFRTDHHWNIQGAWKGYQKIYGMLSPNFQEINPELKVKGIKPIPGVEFLGTFARDSLHPIPPDKFEIAEVDMPPYELYINKKLAPERTVRDVMA